MSPVAFGGVPRTGWIRGQFDNSKVDLQFDNRPPMGVHGQVERSSVNLNNNTDTSTITGSAYNKAVDLNYNWTPQLVHYQGQAAGKDYELDVDYTNHRAVGHNGNSGIDVNFDDYGIHGEAGGEVNVNVTGDGHMTGVMCGRTIQAETANVEMGTVVSNIFLFAPGT